MRNNSFCFIRSTVSPRHLVLACSRSADRRCPTAWPFLRDLAEEIGNLYRGPTTLLPTSWCLRSIGCGLWWPTVPRCLIFAAFSHCLQAAPSHRNPGRVPVASYHRRVVPICHIRYFGALPPVPGGWIETAAKTKTLPAGLPTRCPNLRRFFPRP